MVCIGGAIRWGLRELLARPYGCRFCTGLPRGREILGTAGLQYLFRFRDLRRVFRMHRNEDVSSLNPALVTFGLILRNAHPDEGPSDSSNCTANRRTTKGGNDRSGCDERADAGNRESANSNQPSQGSADCTACRNTRNCALGGLRVPTQCVENRCDLGRPAISPDFDATGDATLIIAESDVRYLRNLCQFLGGHPPSGAILSNWVQFVAPPTPPLLTRSTKRPSDKSEGLNWVQGLDLNQRPSGYEPDELPGCSTLQWKEEGWTGASPCQLAKKSHRPPPVAR